MWEVTVFGAKLRIEFSFLLFTALLTFFRDSGGAAAFFIVCAIHECAHAAALHAGGGRVAELTLCGSGIRIKPVRRPLPPLSREITVLLAGPLANLVVWAVLKKAEGFHIFAEMNFCAAVYNLMPYSFLDGGSILRLLADNSDTPHRVFAAEKIVQAAVPAIFLYLTIKNTEYLPFFLCTLFCFVSEIKQIRL